MEKYGKGNWKAAKECVLNQGSKRFKGEAFQLHNSNVEVRCTIAIMQVEEEANEAIDFRIKEMNGSIREANSKEEFVTVDQDFKILIARVFIDLIMDENISKRNTVSRVNNYLIIAYKIEINAMIDHKYELDSLCMHHWAVNRFYQR